MSRSRLYPPSVDPGFPVLPPQPEGWERTNFGRVVEVVERPVKLDSRCIYKLVTAKRSRGGIVLRNELPGREILTKTQFETKAGDFIISRRQIIHGACGIVPSELDGAVVSNEYSTLRTRPNLLVEFLRHYSHTSYFQRTCFHSSHGVDVEKMIFKVDEWLARDVDVPPVPEQRKIVAILSAVDDAIEATQAIIDQLQVVKKAMMVEMLTRGLPGRHTRFDGSTIGDVPAAWKVQPLGLALEGIDAGWSPQCLPRVAEPDEWGVLKVSAVSWGAFRPHENKLLPPGLEARPDIEVKVGDVLVSRANTPDLVGRSVLVRATRPRLMLSDKLLRLRSKKHTMTPGFLNWVLGSPMSRAQIEEGATGSSRSMKNISQEVLRSLLVPIPPIDEQNLIIQILDGVANRDESEVALLGALRNLRAALMSVLLTGEVRVTPDKDAA